MKSQPILLIIAIAMTATACGKVGDLEPRTGNSLPPKANGLVWVLARGIRVYIQ
mgnify:CR=1 FL=1